jgi:phosphate-selective porin
MKKLLLIICLAAAFLLTSSLYAADKVEDVINLLVEKGIITTEEAAKLRADIAMKEQEEKEQQKEFIVIAGRAIRISGYTQVRYRQGETIKDTFDIRRARIDIKGDITPKFDYRLQADFASSPKVLDATIGYKFNPYLKLTAGQFKIPFSQENLISSSKLETINRSQVVEALVARGQDVIGNHNGRDIGMQGGGNFLKKGDAYLFDYALGVFDGAGINISDTNDQKDIVCRLVFHPFKDWSIGSSYYTGRYTLASAPAIRDKRKRAGIEFSYVHDPVTVKGEYIQGSDGSTDREGWYLLAGCFFVPKKLQAVLKADVYDPDTDIETNKSNVYTLGANVYVNKWVYLQINYEKKDEQGAEIDNNALTGQLTLQF